jgi:hypothetical protein
MKDDQLYYPPPLKFDPDVSALGLVRMTELPSVSDGEVYFCSHPTCAGNAGERIKQLKKHDKLEAFTLEDAAIHIRQRQVPLSKNYTEDANGGF